MNRIFLFLLLIIFFIISCKKESEPEVNDVCKVSYQNDVFPILDFACNVPGCHVSGFENGDFTQYQDLKERADSGSLWFLVGVVQSMPPLNSLDTTQINLIKEWIDCGAIDN